jgi:hypothetical protein
MGAVPKAVPSAVAPQAQNSVQVLTGPQLGPREKGPFSPLHPRNSVNPVVPRTEVDGEDGTPSNPRFGGTSSGGTGRISGGEGAPSVPVNGYLFVQGPIDQHYTNADQGGRNPFRKINNPATEGKDTLTEDYGNNAAHDAQDVSLTGFRVRPGQQRTSHMRVQLPNKGRNGSPGIQFIPRYRPQTPATYKYMPATGTQQYGTGVLNSDTYGAGQTAGGIGGNQYTPTPGPPTTTSTANQSSTSAEPTWG